MSQVLCWLGHGAMWRRLASCPGAEANTSLMGPPQVGTPITAAIRYREAAALGALGLSPYAGSSFHGPPLALAGMHAAGGMLRTAAFALTAATGWPSE